MSRAITLHGPVSALVGAPTAVTLSGMSAGAAPGWAAHLFVSSLLTSCARSAIITIEPTAAQRMQG